MASCPTQEPAGSEVAEFMDGLRLGQESRTRRTIAKMRPPPLQHLERCLELSPSSPPASSDFLAKEASVFCAWFRGDPILAERWIAQSERQKPIPPLLGIRTKIAVDCARHNFDDALDAWRKGADFFERLPATLIKTPLQESWREWGLEIPERKAASIALTADS